MTTKPIAIIIRKIIRHNHTESNALSYTLDKLTDRITEVHAAVSEHDIDVEFGLIRRFGIRSAPVLIFERNGAEITRLTGLVSADEIMDAIDYAKVEY